MQDVLSLRSENKALRQDLQKTAQEVSALKVCCFVFCITIILFYCFCCLFSSHSLLCFLFDCLFTVSVICFYHILSLFDCLLFQLFVLLLLFV